MGTTSRTSSSKASRASRPGGRLHRVSVKVGRDGDGERDVAVAAASVSPAPPLRERGMRRRGGLRALRRLRQRDRHVAGHLRRDGRGPARHLRGDSAPGTHFLRQAALEEPGAWRSSARDEKKRIEKHTNANGVFFFSHVVQSAAGPSLTSLPRTREHRNLETLTDTRRRTALLLFPALTGRGPTRRSGG